MVLFSVIRGVETENLRSMHTEEIGRDLERTLEGKWRRSDSFFDYIFEYFSL